MKLRVSFVPPHVCEAFQASPELKEAQLEFLKHRIDFTEPPEELAQAVLYTPIAIDVVRRACRCVHNKPIHSSTVVSCRCADTFVSYAHDRLASVTCSVWEIDLEVSRLDLSHIPPNILESYRYQLEDSYWRAFRIRAAPAKGENAAKNNESPSTSSEIVPINANSINNHSPTDTDPERPPGVYISRNLMPRGQHVGNDSWIQSCKNPALLVKEAMLCARERDVMEKVEENMQAFLSRHYDMVKAVAAVLVRVVG